MSNAVAALEYVQGLQLHDIAGPIVAGLTGWFVAWYTTRSNERVATRNSELMADDNITKKLKALIDGYDARVRDLLTEVENLRGENKDLLAEVVNLRGEVKELRQVLDMSVRKAAA
jgi:chromosome segregation ATPase